MIRVVVDDLAFVAADAVVRPATAFLEPTSPALRRLEQVGGPAFWKHLHMNQPLDVGAAVVTAGGDLTADFVIHAVVSGPDTPVSRGGVERAVLSMLQRAADWQLARVATPLLGIGAGNLPFEDAARLLVDTLVAGTAAAIYPQEVCIVVESEEERAFVEACLRGSRAHES